MNSASIPVDLFNPGQVFACLGFLEADAEGGFDWRKDGNAMFAPSAKGEQNPFEAVLQFLAEAEPKRWGPIDYAEPPAKKGKRENQGDISEDDESADEDELEAESRVLDLAPTFPAKAADRMALPIRIGGGNRPIVELGHWADGSSRESFKLHAGNRSADRIARAMLKGVRSFNFDPRGAWTAIDAGYSPNEHKHAIKASPVVEFLAAWGLENARPVESGVRQFRYAAWGANLPPILARTALSGGLTTVPLRLFRFELDLSGKNKVVTFAQEEPRP
jgi:CRISPR-associated protein Csx14